MKYFAAVTLIASGMFAGNAFAAGQDSAWYAGVSGDISFPRETTVTGHTNGNIKYKFSSGGNLAFGYEPQMLNNSMGDVRLELEGGYHALGIKDVTAGGITTKPKNDVKLMTFMGNAYYDIHTGTPFTPYVGAGVGEAHISANKSLGFGATSSSDNRLGYQFMTGVSYTPPSMPHTDLSIGYRYLGTASPQFAAAGGNEKFSAIHDSNFEVGFKYHF